MDGFYLKNLVLKILLYKKRGFFYDMEKNYINFDKFVQFIKLQTEAGF